MYFKNADCYATKKLDLLDFVTKPYYIIQNACFYVSNELFYLENMNLTWKTDVYYPSVLDSRNLSLTLLNKLQDSV